MAVRILLPRGSDRKPIQLTPSTIALGRVVISSLSASTTRDFTANTSIVRLYATSQDVYLKWGATAVTNANFDEVIPAGQIVDLVVPVDASTGLLFVTMRLIERAASAALVVIEK